MENKLLRAIIFITICSCAFAQQDSVLIFLSDTQAPLWFETIFLNDDDNEQATQYIFSSILREERVASVIHAGDVTSIGSSTSQWMKITPFYDSWILWFLIQYFNRLLKKMTVCSFYIDFC